jgi:hypothetical protein
VHDTADVEGGPCSLVSPALQRAPHARSGCMLGSDLESQCQVRPAASASTASGMQRSDRPPRPQMGRLLAVRTQQGFPHPQTHAKGLGPAWGASNSPASFRVDLTVSAPGMALPAYETPPALPSFRAIRRICRHRGVPRKSMAENVRKSQASVRHPSSMPLRKPAALGNKHEGRQRSNE